MKTQSLKTPWARTSGLTRSLAVVTLAAGAWALSAMGSQAHASGGVHWSIGVNTPGVAVGVSNAPPVYYGPPPVYYAPRPVYHAPRPIYYGPPPVYYGPPPAYYAPRPHYRSGWGPAPRWERDHRGGWHGHRHDGRRGRN